MLNCLIDFGLIFRFIKLLGIVLMLIVWGGELVVNFFVIIRFMGSCNML